MIGKHLRKNAATVLVFALASVGVGSVSGCMFDDSDPSPGPSYDPNKDAGAGNDSGNYPGPDGGDVGATVSGPLPVNDLVAEMSVQSYGPDVRAYATLRHEKYPGDLNPDDVVLTDGDTLTVRTADNGPETVMTRETDTPGYTVRYIAILPQPASSAPFDVIIGFRRTNGKDGAPYSKTTVSGPFQITSAVPATVAYGANIDIQVSNAFDTNVAATNLEVWGPCIQNYYADQPFTGVSTTFNTTNLKYHADAPPAQGCDIHLRVRADSNGQVDSAFQRGAFGHIGDMPGLQAREIVTHYGP